MTNVQQSKTNCAEQLRRAPNLFRALMQNKCCVMLVCFFHFPNGFCLDLLLLSFCKNCIRSMMTFGQLPKRPRWPKTKDNLRNANRIPSTYQPYTNVAEISIAQPQFHNLNYTIPHSQFHIFQFHIFHFHIFHFHIFHLQIFHFQVFHFQHFHFQMFHFQIFHFQIFHFRWIYRKKLDNKIRALSATLQKNKVFITEAAIASHLYLIIFSLLNPRPFFC